MTYRDELEQAHKRIEQLEEELLEERAKNEPKPEPEPVIRVAPTPAVAPTSPDASLVSTRYLEWYAWWPIPVTIAAAIACFFRFHDEVLTWVARSALAGGALMVLDAILCWRNSGTRPVAGRLLVVLACIVGAPAIIAAFMVGGPIVGVGMGVIAAIAGLVALVKWIATGSSD